MGGDSYVHVIVSFPDFENPLGRHCCVSEALSVIGVNRTLGRGPLLKPAREFLVVIVSQSQMYHSPYFDRLHDCLSQNWHPLSLIVIVKSGTQPVRLIRSDSDWR